MIPQWGCLIWIDQSTTGKLSYTTYVSSLLMLKLPIFWSSTLFIIHLFIFLNLLFLCKTHLCIATENLSARFLLRWMSFFCLRDLIGRIIDFHLEPSHDALKFQKYWRNYYLVLKLRELAGNGLICICSQAQFLNLEKLIGGYGLTPNLLLYHLCSRDFKERD